VPIGSVTTADLRAKLNCYCDGEDSHITIERYRERRHNIKRCNLKGSSTLSHQREKRLQLAPRIPLASLEDWEVA
jgi:hypothetical protein